MMGVIRNAIAIASGKGGVGKTTVAVNLAVTLAEAGARVGLLDADVWGPSVPAMTGMVGRRPRAADGELVEPLESFGVRLMSMGFLVEEGESLAFRGPAVHQVIREFIEDVAWGDLDYLFVDLPPGTGDAVLTLLHNLRLSGAIIVSTPQNVAVASVVRCVALFRERRVPLLGLVENMSESVCPHCGGNLDVFGPGRKVRDLCAYWDIPFLGSIPLDVAVRAAGDEGVPVVVAAGPPGPAALAFRLVAARLARRCAPNGRVPRTGEGGS